MSWYGEYSYGYFRQATIDELRSKAQKSARKLEKGGRTLNPVLLLGGRTIAHTWWGKAWCDNLDRYADLSNRVDRGKRYLRADCVIDLSVSKGSLKAIVQGSRTDPYNVDVTIDPLSDEDFSKLVDRCTVRADNLESLVAGDFPEELKEQLLAPQGGLFPTPREIRFRCSCPDSARLCKHIAATILGVAPQLDLNPLLLFELRGCDTTDLIKRTVKEKLNLMLEHADDESPRIMDVSDEELSALFGVF